MTRDEILAMKPGEELDILIAEKIFGYEVFESSDLLGEKITKYVVRNNWPCELGLYGNFSPSTNIAIAWQVVEKLKMFSMTDGLALLLHNDYGKWYIAENEYGDLIGIAKGDTAPEAIAKASLIAVMGVEK
jgi:hypothetical protein